jgi:hypothetical protein
MSEATGNGQIGQAGGIPQHQKFSFWRSECPKVAWAPRPRRREAAMKRSKAGRISAAILSPLCGEAGGTPTPLSEIAIKP